MKSNSIIDANLQKYREELDELLQKVEELADALNNKELKATSESLRKNINEPFLFVVVGEVKAGKSSFVNALLEADVCATDIEPCTDTIQQIIYAKSNFSEQIEPNLRKVGLPIEILKDISVVDTPGTNTVIADHQIITERYIPNSDITFFVLFGKNPYQKSAWDFLNYVSAQWRKKVVFILQQADILKPEDLRRNIDRVREYANQRQISSPIIFATSAEKELSGEADSGFNEVRNYIKDMVASGESYKIKLRSVSKTNSQIIENLAGDIQNLKIQLEADRQAASRINNKIETGKQRSRYEIINLVDRLSDRYDSIANSIKLEFRDSLSVLTVIKRSFVGIFNKEASIQAWIENFKEDCQLELKSSLEEVSNEGAKHFVDGIRQLLEGLTEELERVQTNDVKSDRIDIKILERRQEVIESVKSKVEKLLSDRGLVTSLNANANNMAVEIVGGAFVAVAGAILNIIEFAVAEAILNAIGIAFAGVGVIIFAVGIAWQRRGIINKFESALDRERSKFRRDVGDRLEQKLGLIYEEVERIFVQFFDYVAREEKEIAPIIDRYESVRAESETIMSKMASKLSDSTSKD